MGDVGDNKEDRALWQRWRAEEGATERVAMPDAMSLAAYADGRLSEEAAAPIEAWLALHPAALEDVVVARDMTKHPPRLAYATILAQASALVDGDAPANVIPLHPRAPRWRNALAWSGIAASLAVASMAGFAMGNDAYTSVSTPQANAAVATESFEAPASLDSLIDDSGA
jgi:anti-sigma factor RsiW